MAGATHYVKIDRTKTLAEEPHTGHNRWHEAIPPIVTVHPGDPVVMEARDALDAQFNPASTTDDVGRAAPMPCTRTPARFLSGARNLANCWRSASSRGDVTVRVHRSDCLVSGSCGACTPRRTSPSGRSRTAGRPPTDSRCKIPGAPFMGSWALRPPPRYASHLAP